MQALQRRIKIFLAIFLVITAIGTFGFMALEDLSFIDAFYYNIVTMSTVGYGDIHPTKHLSRMLAIFLIVMGVGTFLAVIANATEIFLLKREVENRMRKVNMVLGVFFSEVGYKLLQLFSSAGKNIEDFRVKLLVGPDWSEKEFLNGHNLLKKNHLQVDIEKIELEKLFNFLGKKRGLLISLLENPVLVEHEGFSETLLSVFHMSDELSCRGELTNLPKSDINHLSGDINRAYHKLADQWLGYLKHLKEQYPYLFSLAVRRNPFDPEASPIVL